MSPPGKFTLRLAIYGILIAYLAGDLCMFKGPLRRSMDLATPTTPEVNARTKNQDIVARVFNHPITRSQLERAVCERLWTEGKPMGSLTPDQRKTVRLAALQDLIDHELLRAKAGSNDPQLVVGDEEINERLRRFPGRFDSNEEMTSVLKSQGIASGRELRDMLAARIQQEKYIESRIGPLVRVTDTEARQWMDDNRRDLTDPERVEARHIFIPTLEHAPEEAHTKLTAALADLTARRKDFATLAGALSEDPATRETGGSLGWMSRDRLPADFAAAVFTLASNKPTLVRTRIGWHLIEVTGRKPAEPRTFEQAKPEILAALEAVKRRVAIHDFRAALRRNEASHIEVYQDRLSE